MGYAVYHAEKGKISSDGIGNHIDRTEGQEKSFKHADPTKRELNINRELKNNYHDMKLADAINDRIEKGYKNTHQIRKNAVKYVTHILTGSHEDMVEIFKDKDKSQAWLDANYKFISDEFGEENIVRFTLHMDEKTPHIHAVTVPLTKDGRLSAYEVFGKRKDLQERQDKYAKYMAEFGLERGLKLTGVKHEDAKTFYARIKKAIEEAEITGELAVKSNLLGFVKKETINKAKEEIKTLKTSLIALNEELKKVKSDLHLARTQANYNAERLRIAEMALKEQKNTLNELILNSDKYNELREKEVSKSFVKIENDFENLFLQLLEKYDLESINKNDVIDIYNNLLENQEGNISTEIKADKGFFNHLFELSKRLIKEEAERLRQEEIKAQEEAKRKARIEAERKAKEDAKILREINNQLQKKTQEKPKPEPKAQEEIQPTPAAAKPEQKDIVKEVVRKENESTREIHNVFINENQRYLMNLPSIQHYEKEIKSKYYEFLENKHADLLPNRSYSFMLLINQIVKFRGENKSNQQQNHQNQEQNQRRGVRR